MGRLTDTAWGLEPLPENSWRWEALCDGHWDDWTEFVRIEATDAAVVRIAHLCKAHCPVYSECLKWTEGNPPEQGIIQAGRYRNHYGRLDEIDDRHAACAACGLYPRPGRQVAMHGTFSGYKNGCRCDPCRETGKAANKAAYDRRKQLATAGAR